MLTYQEFIKQEASTKKVLFQIGNITILEDNLWVFLEDNVWVTEYSYNVESIQFDYGTGKHGYLSYGDSGTDEPPEPSRPTVADISSVLGGAQQLTEVNNYDDLKENPDSFYWDKDTQFLYIATADGKSPTFRWNNVSIGVTQTFSNISGYYGETYYDGRILSMPSITTDRDSLFYGKISYEGGSVTLDNIDGYFDFFSSENYLGSEVKILFGGENVADYQTLYTGYIETFQVGNKELSVSFKDTRKLLSETLPKKEYNIIDYPNVYEKEIGAPVPLCYGLIKNGKAINIGGNVFKFADTTDRALKSIIQVYVNGEAITHTNEDLLNGTFQISGFEGKDIITLDFEGYVEGTELIDNPMNVLKDILLNNANVVYNDYYFNIEQWEYVTNNIVYKINMAVYKEVQIIDLIESISKSIHGSFIVDELGRFSFELRDITKESSRTIEYNEYLQDPIKNEGITEYLNSAKVQYDKDYTTNNYLGYTNDTLKQELFDKYRKHQQETYDTFLTTATDAEILTGVLLESFGGIFPTYTILTKTQNIDLSVGDNIIINSKIRLSADDTYIKGEIVEKIIDLDSFTIQFRVRYISDITSLTEENNGYSETGYGTGGYFG